ncbi:hypothetical protein [Lebetimonas natsushimae]|nr:hypothetical protein [Lebetimonas natsushimae]
MKFILKYSGDILERFFIRIANEMNLKIGVKKENEFTYIFLKGEENEIEEFSKKLANELPMSIFLNSLDASVSEDFIDYIPEFPKRNLPPCPRCLSEVKNQNNENYYNPFHHCEICGYQLNEKLIMGNEKFNINDKNERKKYFEKIAEKLKKEGVVSIGTFNGKYKLTTNLENADKIVAVNLGAVAEFFMSFEGDAKALASIEKPYVKLKTNLQFKKTFGISKPAFYVKLPDDMVLELLCEEINDEIKLLGLIETKKVEFFDFDVKKDEEIIAVVTDTREHVIIPERGDRSLIPKFEKSLGDVVGTNSKFVTISNEEKSVIKLNDENLKAKENPLYLAGFYGVLDMWNLEDKITLGISLYKEEKSKILLNSPKFGLVEYISFDFKYNSFEEIFALISSMNDTGKKLIKNFSQKRNDLFLNALSSNIQTNKKGIYYLWGLIGIVLGFADNVDEAAEKLIEFARSAMTKKGPRIDYKMDERNLNPLWAIRTAMSFRLAGVDDYLLSFGVIESFAEFLNNIYETLNKEMVLSGAVLVGDLFEGEFLNKVYTYISKNYPVFVPKALPMSGAIESYGNAVINSKS